eukprot:10412-Heterococcus_DN1.PRE.1
MAVSSFAITIDGEEVQRFSSYGQEAPRAPPLPEPGSDADKFSFEYTGRHDDGDLLPPRSGGAHEIALNAILSVKDESNRFMSEVIDIERAHGRGNLAYYLN